MAIVYCSWETGDDTTGDGTAANPYKTITKASTSRSPGDEVRVAKSPEPTALTGTTAWAKNSKNVTGINTLFTSELAIGDFIKAPDGYWYEIITITNDTNVVLYRIYPSENSSGYSSQKLGVTDTGAAAAANTQIQVLGSSGDATSPLYISGGWDLSTETQTGQTYFRQMHSTFGNRYGYGIHTNKKYINIDKINMLRYSNGFNFTLGADYITFMNVTCSSNSSNGIYYFGGTGHNIKNAICISNNSNGISGFGSNGIIENIVCNANGDNGFSSGSDNITIEHAICNYNNNNGILIGQYTENVIMKTINCNYNGGSGIYFYVEVTLSIIEDAICNYNKFGVYMNAKSNANLIKNVVCNYNTNHGVFFENSHYNHIKNAVCNYNTYNGVDFYNGSANNVINLLTTNYNNYAINYNGAVSNLIKKLLANANTTAVFRIDSGSYTFNNGCYKATIGVNDNIFSNTAEGYSDAIIYINNLNGYSYIKSRGAIANSQDATAGGTGKEWKLAVTNLARNSSFPFYIPIARIAINPNEKVTVTIYFKKSGTGIAGALRCQYGQVEWSDAAEDIIINCPDDTNRNQVTLEFTPTEAGVVEIEALAWYVSATDQNVIIDDITITQA